MMSKKGESSPDAAFEYECNCGKHFVSVGKAVAHINKFKDHQLRRVTV
ncbi:MAG: hypothetical protein H3Z50_01695 [archaeon]|nr:hypothetical protein [archaeon]